MKIIEKKISELKPYANNPRMNDDAVEKVAQSIQEFGFKVPIVVDKDGVVVCGHTRLKAAKKLGIEKLPCVVADDLTPKQIQAFRLADNKTSDFSIWDNKKLLEELEEIGGGVFTGFETSDFLEDVNSMADVEKMDESDNRVIADNESGIEYKLTFKTNDKDMVEAVKDFIISRGGVSDE